ncbi:HAD-IA family hydrolase [uncultured Sphaerochaeta sp.]|uniref:HAD family hydrolase n=1 Tax=uncultured Sphaerochaeta sp. TaxID=886478 RepID=UPI002A0A6469|nr:HAD-IA family hydrolase [uncultured Sphaerochaeta sp.]
MVDRCCLDFSLSSFPGQEEFERLLASHGVPVDHYPFREDSLSTNRCLLVSDSQERLDRAKKGGFCTLGIGSSLIADHIASSLEDERVFRPLFTLWSDSREGCQLFIFDMGNVIIKNIRTLKKIVRHWHLPEQEFMEDFRGYDAPLMDGFISTSQYWAHVEHKFGIRVEGEPFAQEFKPIFNDEMVAVLKQLHQEGKRIVCGSNTFAPHWEIIERMGALALFDRAYASHEMGISKPASQFFTYILNKEGYEAKDVYFVDDYEENIESASKMGIHCLLYADGGMKSGSEKLQEVFGSK